jgi:hypothetical protein
MPEFNVHSKPTKLQIIRARLRMYFGSQLAHMFIGASVALPFMYAYAQKAGSNAAQLPSQLWFAPAFSLFFIPLGIAFAGINGPEIRSLCENGVQYRINDSGLTATGPAGSAQLTWAPFKRWFEMADAFVILSGTTLILLPKSAIESHGEMRDLLRRRIGA